MNTLEPPPPQELPPVPIYNKLCPADKKWLYQLLTSIEMYTDPSEDPDVVDAQLYYLSTIHMPSAMLKTGDYDDFAITLVKGDSTGSTRLVRTGVEEIILTEGLFILYERDSLYATGRSSSVVRYSLRTFFEKNSPTVDVELRHFDMLFSTAYPDGISLFNLTKVLQASLFRLPKVTKPEWEMCVPEECEWQYH